MHKAVDSKTHLAVKNIQYLTNATRLGVPADIFCSSLSNVGHKQDTSMGSC